MARYLTAGVVVLADDHPHSQGTIDTARAYAGHRYAVGHDGDSRFQGFDQVVDPGRDKTTVAAAFKEAARLRIPWIAVRRDIAPPPKLLAQLLEATARRSSKDVPGFAVLLTGPERRIIRRILAIVDRSDGHPSGLLALAAVAAAEEAAAGLDVLVIGAPGEELNTSAQTDEILRVARDRDLYEQAMRRSTAMGARANWMFIDHVDNRIHLVRDILAAKEYDLVVDDLGNLNLGGRIGRTKRIDKALRKGGPASITMAVLKQSDLPVLLVLDGVRLGLIPAKVKAGAGASVLMLGVMVSAAPKAAASPGERAQAQTSISQTIDSYDQALTDAANLAAPAQVAESQDQAQASADQAEAALTGEQVPAAEAEAASAEQAEDQTQADQDAAQEHQADEQAADEQAAEDQAAGEQTRQEVEEGTESDVAADDEQAAADQSLAALDPEDVEPKEAPSFDGDDVDVPDDVSRSDVDDANEAAEESKDALDEAEQDFEEAQDAAIEAQEAAETASAAAVETGSELDAANASYEQVTATTDDVIADATGVSGALPGGSTAEDMAAAEAQEADAIADLGAASQAADEAVQEYQDLATEAIEASAELEQAAADVTAAQTAYNEDEATAEATEGAYEEKMADERVSPVAEGEYHESGHYGDAGPYWSTGYHTGEDYAAPVGTEVVAAASGTVVEVTHDHPSYGNQIVIEHEDGYYTSYSHLSEINVTEGQEVIAGDTIGEVGNTGNSTGPHLHFEVTQGGDGWSGGEFVDPDAWLSGEVG